MPKHVCAMTMQITAKTKKEKKNRVHMEGGQQLLSLGPLTMASLKGTRPTKIPAATLLFLPLSLSSYVLLLIFLHPSIP